MKTRKRDFTGPSLLAQQCSKTPLKAIDRRHPVRLPCRPASFLAGRFAILMFYISIIWKSALEALQSGQFQVSGTSSQRVPGAMPSCGRPAASSYTNEHSAHCQVFNPFVGRALFAASAACIRGRGKFSTMASSPSVPAQISNGPSSGRTNTSASALCSLF